MKNLKILFLFLTVLSACTSNPGYQISGHLDDLDDNTYILLKAKQDGNYVTVDSVRPVHGDFELTGTVEKPDIYYLQVADKRGSLLLFMENGQFNITGDADSLWMAKASGAPAQDVYNDYVKESSTFDVASEKLYGQWRDAQMSGDKELIKKIEGQYDSLYAEKEKFDSAFMVNHPSTLVAPYLLRGMAYDMEGDQMLAFIDSFDPAIQDAALVKELRDWAEAKKRSAIGQPAIDFTLTDTAGNEITLSDLYGNYLLIDFWAAWCGPCRRENPNVVAAYQKYHEKGFDIIGVSLDRSKDDWLKAIKDDHLTWTQVSDLNYWNSAVPKLYGVRAIPANFLLDREGTIIAKNLRSEALDKKLAELLD